MKDRFLRLILLFYPPWFRRRYGDEMKRALAADRRAAGWRFWPCALYDALRAGLRLRLGDRPTDERKNTMENLRQDLAYAIRTLAKRPGWTLAAAATLALGIGATTAIFSLVNDILLRPLPYPEPEELVLMRLQYGESGRVRESVSHPAYSIISEAEGVTEGLGCFYWGDMTVDLGGGSERILTASVSSHVLRAMGASPLSGRLFAPQDDAENAQPAAILSFGLWQERFGGSEDVLGRTIEISDKPHAVIGVLPRQFVFNDMDVRVWKSLAGMPRSEGSHYLAMMGRLREGLSLQQARARVEALRLEVPTGAPGETAPARVRVEGYRDYIVGDTRQELLMFQAAVLAVLLIGCLNVANLVLSRSAARQREIALRSALGAGRIRLMRQLLTESLLLSAAGGLAGCLLAPLLLQSLLSISPEDLPRADLAGIDLPALIFAAGLSLLAGIAVGLLPALRNSRPDLRQGLGEGSGGTSGVRHSRLRNVLAVTQVAAALVLLIASGLLLKSLSTLSGREVGFRHQGIVGFFPVLPQRHYSQRAQHDAYFQELGQRLRALPQIGDVAFMTTTPFGGGHIGEGVRLEGDARPREEIPAADVEQVSPGAFRMLEIPLLAGRVFDESDRPGASRRVVLNRHAARQWFGGPREALGKSFSLGSFERERKVAVVGVVGDIRPYRPARELRPMVFEPIAQIDDWKWGRGVLVKLADDGAGAIPLIREIAAGVDDRVPLARVSSLGERLERYLVLPRFRFTVLAAFAATALLLALIGVYGVLSHLALQRTREVGVRMALGANRARILRWMALDGLRLTAVGSALGLAVALSAARVMESYLYDTTPYDTTAFLGSLAALAAAALLACYLPARRASRIDPMRALRCE